MYIIQLVTTSIINMFVGAFVVFCVFTVVGLPLVLLWWALDQADKHSDWMDFL